MSNTPDLLLIAVQMGWTDKYDGENPPQFKAKNGKSYNYDRSRGWTNVAWTLEELAKSIGDGYSFCPQLTTRNGKQADYDDFKNHEDFYWKGTYRNDKSFFQTNVVAVDIDEGYDSIEAISKIEFFQHYGMLLYTTASHDPDYGKIKARIVFRTENIIKRKEQMKFIYTAFNSRFGGDPQYSDSCRLFYGSEHCDLEKYPERFIPKAVVRQLVKEGKSLYKKAIGYTKKTSTDAPTDEYINNHSKQLPQDQEFKLNDGESIQFKDVPKKLREIEQDLNRAGKMQCYCPLPDHGSDAKPGAFLSITSGTRLPYFFCDKCSKDRKSYFIETKKSDLESLRDIELIRENNRYMGIIPDLRGCILVKSPKGTGKTTRLVKLVKQWQKDKKKVLLLGHRVSLLSSMASKLGLNLYKEPKYTVSRDQVIHSKHFALCVNSLWRLSSAALLNIPHYDVVILDESEQVIEHLASSTILRKKRYKVIERFYKFIRKAEQVYCLDADLGNLTIDVICKRIRGETDEVIAILNEYKSDKNEVILYDNKRMFLDGLMTNVGQDGQKIAILSNSKTFVTIIENAILKMHPELDVVCIHGENSNSPEMQNFIGNINDHCKKIDVLIASPSIGTGVDITTPFDKVYGCFEHLSGNTHQDIDQHLHRIRNFNAMHVWISKNFDTARVDASEIEWAMEQINRRTNELIRFVDEEPDHITRLYLSILSMVKAKVNRSRNQLRNNWIGLQHENGIPVKLIVDDKDKELENAGSYRHSKRELNEKWLADLHKTLKSEDEDPSYIAGLMSKQDLSYDEKLLVEAEKIRDFYALDDYDLDFLQLHQEGLMHDVRRFELLTREVGDIGIVDLNERTWGYIVGDRRQESIKVIVQKYILKVAGLKDCYDTTTQVTKAGMGKLIDLIAKKKADIEDILDITIRKDYEKQIIRVFSKMLETMGLRTVSEQRRNEGKLQRFYSLNGEHLKTIQLVLKRRGQRQSKFIEAKNPVITEVVVVKDEKIIDEILAELATD